MRAWRHHRRGPGRTPGAPGAPGAPWPALTSPFCSSYPPYIPHPPHPPSPRNHSFSAYPWYTSVRKTLEDPAYRDWYIKFKHEGPWYSSKCDAVNTTDCSDLYHNQEQSPGFPHGDGDCGAPNCDCGNNVPCG